MPARADGDNNTTILDYNASNRPTCVTNPNGNKTSYGYDSRGNVTAVIDGQNTDEFCAAGPLSAQATITYNAANQPLVVTDGDGHATTYAYDSQGRLTGVTNARNETTTYTHVTASLTAGGTATLVETATDPLGRTTTYAYTGLGQVASITNALSQVTTLDYDPAGRLVKTPRPGPVATCHEYDNANHLTATIQNCVPGQPATVAQNVRTEYGFDGAGRPTWAKGPTGEVARTFYNARGLVERTVAGCAVAGTPSATTCDAYDPASPERNRATAIGYNDRGRRITATDPLGVATRTEYDTAGRPYRTTRNYVQGGRRTPRPTSSPSPSTTGPGAPPPRSTRSVAGSAPTTTGPGTSCRWSATTTTATRRTVRPTAT